MPPLHAHQAELPKENVLHLTRSPSPLLSPPSSAHTRPPTENRCADIRAGLRQFPRPLFSCETFSAGGAAMGAWARAPLALAGVKHAVIADKELRNRGAAAFPVGSAMEALASRPGGGVGSGGGTVAVVTRDLPAKVGAGWSWHIFAFEQAGWSNVAPRRTPPCVLVVGHSLPNLLLLLPRAGRFVLRGGGRRGCFRAGDDASVFERFRSVSGAPRRGTPEHKAAIALLLLRHARLSLISPPPPHLPPP